MRLRVVGALVMGVLLLVFAPSAGAVNVYPTKLTVDSSVDVGGGVFLYSGRVANRYWNCQFRPIHLTGVRPNGKRTELDWALSSLDGDAWALAANPEGFKAVRVEVWKKTPGSGKHRRVCQAASVKVFPPMP
jgi:hypothetical protein